MDGTFFIEWSDYTLHYHYSRRPMGSLTMLFPIPTLPAPTEVNAVT